MINKTYPNLSTLITHSIFKEPYKVDKGTVYYFNNGIVIIKSSNINKDISYKYLRYTYSIKVIYNNDLFIYTTRLTKQQFENIYKLIL